MKRAELGRLYLALLILAALLSGCRLRNTASNAGPLVASGTIRVREVHLATELGGRIERVHVEVGAEVQAGEVLVTLDETPWAIQLGPAEAAVRTAEAELAALKAGARPAEIEAARAAVALAEAQREGAQAAWARAQETLQHPQELDSQIREARTRVALAAQQLEFADAELRNTQARFDRRKAAEWELRAAKAAYAKAQADHATAQTLLDHLLAIRYRPLGYAAQAHAAEGQLRVAEAGVTVAEAKLAHLLAGPTPEEIAVAEARVRLAQAEAEKLRTQIEKCTLTSPLTGLVLNQTLYAGEIVAPGAPILTLADLDEVRLTVYVPVNRIGEIQLGQPVTVTVDSWPNRTFPGHVARIGTEPEYTPRNVTTVEERQNTFYAVEILLPNPDHALKPGMPADATF
ncbi:MAG: HlyD family secretion protein [Anaerolineae bacterium]